MSWQNVYDPSRVSAFTCRMSKSVLWVTNDTYLCFLPCRCLSSMTFLQITSALLETKFIATFSLMYCLLLCLDNHFLDFFFYEGPCSFLLWCAPQFCTHDCAPGRQLWHAAWPSAAGGRYPVSSGPDRHIAMPYWDSGLTNTHAADAFLCQLCGIQPKMIAASPASRLALQKLYSCTLASLVSYNPGAFDWLHKYSVTRLNIIFKSDISQKHDS